MRPGTQWFVGSRRSGKSTELLRWMSVDDRRVVLCSDQARADMLRATLRGLWPTLGQEAYEALASRIRVADRRAIRGQDMQIAVDDVHALLESYLGRPLAVASLDTTYDTVTTLPTRLIDAI